MSRRRREIKIGLTPAQARALENRLGKLLGQTVCDDKEWNELAAVQRKVAAARRAIARANDAAPREALPPPFPKHGSCSSACRGHCNDARCERITSHQRLRCGASRRWVCAGGAYHHALKPHRKVA